MTRHSLPDRWPSSDDELPGGFQPVRRTVSQAAADAAAAILVAASGRASSGSPAGYAHPDEDGDGGVTGPPSWGALSARSRAAAPKLVDNYDERCARTLRSPAYGIMSTAVLIQGGIFFLPVQENEC